MNATVLLIQQTAVRNEFSVFMSIGDSREQFTFTVDLPQQEPFFVVSGDDRCCQIFRFNQQISAKVGELVGEIYLGKRVEFPAHLGTFLTPEEAIAMQKPFPKQPALKR
ncbi:MAG: hypothetical protein GDA43_20040 [Hormoscilla sp. SP5CHS1]|nr:hypothetical protein [Hormoscilla sp. SP12CHS1]MBC6455206.1 hypothetical protein [Hormoscilla sp. SP5CHS1]MBC6475496.1 hypothetical protein [Hormoscilla sp. GM102CHS1]